MTKYYVSSENEVGTMHRSAGITGAVRGSSRKKFLSRIRFGILSILLFFELTKNESLKYLFSNISPLGEYIEQEISTAFLNSV